MFDDCSVLSDDVRPAHTAKARTDNTIIIDGREFMTTINDYNNRNRTAKLKKLGVYKHSI